MTNDKSSIKKIHTFSRELCYCFLYWLKMNWLVERSYHEVRLLFIQELWGIEISESIRSWGRRKETTVLNKRTIMINKWHWRLIRHIDYETLSQATDQLLWILSLLWRELKKRWMVFRMFIYRVMVAEIWELLTPPYFWLWLTGFNTVVFIFYKLWTHFQFCERDITLDL